MSKTKVKLPSWLKAAIKKYAIAKVSNIEEIFEAFLMEESLDSPRFRTLCERLVKKGNVKKTFVSSLEKAGHFPDDEEEVDDSDSDEEEADEEEEEEEEEPDSEEEEDEEYEEDPEDSDEEEEELEELEEEEEDEEEEGEDSDDDEEEAELEEEEEEEEEEEASTTSKRGRPKGSKNKPKSSYEETGIPTLAEVVAYIGDDYNHHEEFENPAHLLITARILSELGFDVAYDSRVEGGTIKRPRGGKFVLEMSASEKRAVKRRGRVAPVFAYTRVATDEFDKRTGEIIDLLVENATTTED